MEVVLIGTTVSHCFFWFKILRNFLFPTVSLVDGYNIPIGITNNKGCPNADCSKDLSQDCSLSEGINPN